MKTVKLKSTVCAFTLQNPSVPAGMSTDGKVATYEITEVPDAVSPVDVLRLADRTAFVTPDARGYSYRFSELGEGRIVH